jgi:predicted HNH restriction endonuclease
MYNLENNVIVLGEAKFYGDLSAGLTEIIKDFTQKNIKNKLESLQIATEICLESSSIIIKNLGSNAYEELTIEQFINQKIIFAGFVLHSESSVSKYGNNDFYDSYEISVELLTQNIKKVLKLDELKGEYEIVMVHLPVSNKKTLIAKIIEASQSRLKAFGGRNE